MRTGCVLVAAALAFGLVLPSVALGQFAVNHDIEEVGDLDAVAAGSHGVPVAKVLADTTWIGDWSFDGASCAPSGWVPLTVGAGVPAGHLVEHATDNDMCTENTTCAWLFSNLAAPTLACRPGLAYGPGGLVVNPGLDEYLMSPLIALPPGPATGTVLRFRMFPGNDFRGARIVLNWSVRSLVAGIFTPWQNLGNFTSLSQGTWVTCTPNLSAFVPGGATDVQVRFRVTDWGPAALPCATVGGSDCGTGPGPYLDHVRIGRFALSGPVISEGIDSRSQAQDCFPADLNAIPPKHFSPTTSRFGTCPFSAGADELTCGANANLLTTDAIHVRVTDTRGVGGVAVTWYGAIVSGPHAGKAPAPFAVGLNGFFAVPPIVVGNDYFVSLDDTYFRGGDVLEYFWVATDAAGGFSSDPSGMVAAPASPSQAENATGGLFEVSFLPRINWSPSYLGRIAADPNGDLDPTPAELANSTQSNCILYVQMVNSRRRSGAANRTAFMYTLDELGYRGHYDVYDVQGFGDTNNQLAGRATIPQVTGYALIVQDSGRRRTAQLPDNSDLDSEKIDQAGWYRQYLAQGATGLAGSASLWLIGENVADANRLAPLLTVDMGLAGIVDDQGLGVSPEVAGVGAFTSAAGDLVNFVGDRFVLSGGCPQQRHYDAANAAGTAVGTHAYKSAISTGPPAVVMNKNVVLKWNTIWQGFPWSDMQPLASAPPGQPSEGHVLAGKVLSVVLPVGCQRIPNPTGTADPEVEAPKPTRLYQNIPNPFNPTTTIRFDLARDCAAKLAIYDVSGHCVRTLLEARLTKGEHTAAWNGLDAAGHRVASGLYFYTLVAADQVLTRRMVMLK